MNSILSMFTYAKPEMPKPLYLQAHSMLLVIDLIESILKQSAFPCLPHPPLMPAFGARDASRWERETQNQIHDAPADRCQVHAQLPRLADAAMPTIFAAEFSRRVSHHTIHPPSLSLLLLLLLLWVPLWERIRVNQG
jgi:hypothetical protein